MRKEGIKGSSYEVPFFPYVTLKGHLPYQDRGSGSQRQLPNK